MPETFDLTAFRQRVMHFYDQRTDREGPYGCIRMAIGQRPDLYSSVDYAITRTIMGEDLTQTVSTAHREQWNEHINSFVEYAHWAVPDGSYFDRMGHSKLHANGQVVSALGVIGGKQKVYNHLYDGFDTPEKIASWLEHEVDWRSPWNESHKFWGGMHCFSRSRRCPPGWLDACFDWLDKNVDPATGFWRKGVEARLRIHYLGGAVHILPIYEHLNRPFGYSRELCDSVLDLQLPAGHWLPGDNPVSYMDLDALYVFHLIRRWLPGYRENDIANAVERYANAAIDFYAHRHEVLFSRHPHFIMAMAGICGLLSRLCPDRFVDREGVKWTDIFSDDRFHQTAAVEMGPPTS